MVGIDAAGVPHNCRQRHLRGDIVQSFEIALDEDGTFQEIERKITADAKLGKNGKVCAKALGLLRKSENARRIAVEVTNGGVELSKGYLHAGWRSG
jgi:hypothetical protein